VALVSEPAASERASAHASRIGRARRCNAASRSTSP
jgi:hypothetical protein